MHETYYNWLIFLVNLQRYQIYSWQKFDYNWLIFLVNLQPVCYYDVKEIYYNWLIFLVNLQPLADERWYAFIITD